MFDESDTETDLVIVSKSDERKLHVYRAIICLASPQLKKRVLALDRGSSDGQPTLTLNEPGPVLESLLQLCYPVPTPHFDALEQLEPVLKAALAYSMDGPTQWLREKLRRDLLQAAPLAAYACACRLHLTEEAESARTAVMLAALSNVGDETDWGETLCNWERIKNDDLLDDSITAFDCISLFRTSTRFSWTLTFRSPKAVKEVEPFGPSSLGDVILKSSDAVEFHVSKVVMSLISPVFRDMFTLPQPKSDTGEDTHGRLPVIPITERSATVYPLLLLSYPPCNFKIDDIPTTMNVLVAANKYDIEAASTFLRERLMIHFAPERPADVFALCASLDLHSETAQAAKCKTVSELELSVNWYYARTSHYRRLRKYHAACGESTAAIFTSDSWYTDHYTWTACIWTACHGVENTISLTTQWLEIYMEETAELIRDAPLDSSILSFDRLLHAATSPVSTSCPSCGPRLQDNIPRMREFCKKLAEEVERRVNEVRACSAARRGSRKGAESRGKREYCRDSRGG